MKNIIKLVPVVVLLGGLGLSCESSGVKTVRSGSSGGYVSGWNIAARDQLEAANNLIGRFLNSPRATKALAGGERVIGVSKIVNQTTQVVYSNILTDNVIQALQESGKCYATATFNFNEVENDPLVLKLRKLRASSEVDQSTVAKKNSLKAPDMTLFGSVTEDVSRKGRNVEKTFIITLKVNDGNSGLQIWSGQYFIAKQGKGGVRSW
jgi:hypothetical protein